MRHTFFFLLILSSGYAAWAQAPQGKLFFYTGPGGVPPGYLACIQYPEETFTLVDSVLQLEDIAAGDGKLYAAAYLDVLVYNTSDYQRVDTLPGAYARKLALWGGNLAVASVAPPFFRVYDMQSHSLLFSLDSTKVSYAPSDMLVDDDKAYLMLNDSLVVVDLLLQDTVAKVATPHPFPFAGYNYFMMNAGGYIYIDVEYVTNALRFSLIRMNKSTYRVDTVFHQENYANFSHPVVAGDKIYLLAFDSHYDITLDSLFLSANLWSPLALDYDAGSGAVFLNQTSPATGINYFLAGSFSDTVSVQGNVSKALFVTGGNDTVNAVAELNSNRVRVYPNPVLDFMMIQLPEAEPVQSIQVYDITGRLMLQQKPFEEKQTLAVDCKGLEQGCYFVKVKTRDAVYSARFTR